MPDGSEAIADIQSLSRSYTNDAGQTVSEEDYIDWGGLSCSPGSMGTAGVNYYLTQIAYGPGGMQDRVISPQGTITRTVFDGLGRPEMCLCCFCWQSIWTKRRYLFLSPTIKGTRSVCGKAMRVLTWHNARGGQHLSPVSREKVKERPFEQANSCVGLEIRWGNNLVQTARPAFG